MTDGKKPRVMVADDELHCRLLMKAILNAMKCEVVGEAKNGQEAIEMFREIKPHLMLLDINMPLKNGDEVLREIMEEFPHAFVIMLTSVADSDSIEECIVNGAANYIRKDTPVEEIKVIIKETWRAFVQGRSGAA